MTHAGIGFFQRRQGSPKNLVQCQCTNLINMKHFVKTGRGVSKDHIQAEAGHTLEGSGQGSGASVGNWQGHNEPMIRTYEQLCQPCTTSNPDGTLRAQQWVASFIDDNKISMSFKVGSMLERIYSCIGTGVTTWRQILRLTGGDLELAKTYIGILTFNFDTFHSKYMGRNSPHKAGVPLVISSNQYEERVTLDQDGREIILTELEPDEGLRLLGIRMSLTGDFHDEFVYRVDQVASMAAKIRAAALDSRDGWMIYMTRYRPMMRYCLPITTFSDAECKTIQRPFIGALINCLGMNRNTKRAVCHGPMRFGGMGIMDVATEQFASRLHLLMTNIRKGNPTGKSILNAYSMYQMYLGCERPFLELDPDYYPCLPATTYSCQYIWQELFKTNSTLKLSEMWTPTKEKTNDRAITDVLVTTCRARKGTPTHINPIEIYLANACRLYLKVTWLSDICTTGGDRIASWAFYGTRQNDTGLAYPHQEKPPELAWASWRKMLRCSVIATGRQIQHYYYFPLCDPIGALEQQVEQSGSRFTNAPRTASMREIIEGMSESWRQVLGGVTFPPDDGLEIAEILRSGNTVKCWSDGSVKNGIGAHAYTLRTKCDDDDLAISGDATTPGHPDDISSLRSESYGGLACLILTWALEYKYEIVTGGYVLLHIDNEEVVKRIKYGVPDAMAAEKFTKTDFDVWNEASELTKELGTSVCAKWVKGHQDKHIEGVYSGIGPISLEAKFNILTDRLAEKRRESSTITFHNIPFQTEKATLIFNSAIVTTHIATHVTMAKSAPAMMKYIKEKTDWTEATFQMVDWDAMEVYMKQVSIGTRAKAVKLFHNWQNTGRQKGLFLMSAGASSEAIHEASRCPMGCGEYEAPLHYLQCTKCPHSAEMANAIKDIKKWLSRANTAPALVGIIMRILYKYTQRQLQALGEWSLQNESNSGQLEQLVQEQELIGWDNFFKGRISKHWSTLQEQHYSTLDLPECQAYKTGKWWASHVIRQLIYFSLNAWQIRNDTLHKDKVQSIYNSERSELRKRIRWWYSNSSKFSRKMQKYFKKTMLERNNDSNQSLACWIDTVEGYYRYAVERGDERAVVSVPPPRESRGG